MTIHSINQPAYRSYGRIPAEAYGLPSTSSFMIPLLGLVCNDFPEYS